MKYYDGTMSLCNGNLLENVKKWLEQDFKTFIAKKLSMSSKSYIITLDGKWFWAPSIIVPTWEGLQMHNAYLMT